MPQDCFCIAPHYSAVVSKQLCAEKAKHAPHFLFHAAASYLSSWSPQQLMPGSHFHCLLPQQALHSDFRVKAAAQSEFLGDWLERSKDAALNRKHCVQTAFPAQ